MNQPRPHESARRALHGAAAICLVVSACDSNTGGGVLDPHAPTAYFVENEPNDSSSHPQPIGPVYPPEQIVIQGDLGYLHFLHLDDADAFALQADEPARIDFALECFGNGDFDLCLYDPFYEEVVAHWESYGDEYGSFDIPGYGQDFQLIVICYSGAGEYDLELRVDRLPAFAPVPTSLSVPEESRPERVKADSGARLEAKLRGDRSEAAARAELLRQLSEAASLLYGTDE